MSQIFVGALQNLIDALGKMPGVEPKPAQRIAFWVPRTGPGNIKNLAATPQTARDTVRFCETCKSITENLICQIYIDPRRGRSLICIVEEAKDIAPLGKTHSYRGLYHVLGGAIDPMSGIGSNQSHIRSLMECLQDAEVKEVIVATNPDVEGEVTVTYLPRLLATLQTPVLRLASGLPISNGSEYTDEVALSRALEGRHSLE